MSGTTAPPLGQTRSLQLLSDEVMRWLNRRDITDLLPGWLRMVETDISETLRARCMVKSGIQAIDQAYIGLPADFCAMESIRDAFSGEQLDLKDEFSGHWSDQYINSNQVYGRLAVNAPARGYRLVANCIEFLPHPQIPDPVPSTWQPQKVLMGWYAAPAPLMNPADTNAVLEKLYSIYLFGVCHYGAVFELDTDRADQMERKYNSAIAQANLWKQVSDYTGAPLRAEIGVVY